MLYKHSFVVAENLVRDDWFKLGGQMYVISSAEEGGGPHNIVIYFYNVNQPDDSGTMVITKETIFKTYANSKQRK